MISISIGIPTLGRESIKRTVCSILAQDIQPQDDICIVSDGPPADWLDVMVRSLGKPWRLAQTPAPGWGCGGPEGAFGSGARQRCIDEARGDRIVWIDDDDCFVEGAVEEIRKQAELYPENPLIFKFMVFNRIVLWNEVGPGIIKENLIAGQQFVPLNRKDRLGKCTDRRPYDYDFIRSTMDLYPNRDKDAVWCDKLIGIWNPALEIPEHLEPLAPCLEAA